MSLENVIIICKDTQKGRQGKEETALGASSVSNCIGNLTGHSSLALILYP